jgi:hypothetical protein
MGPGAAEAILLLLLLLFLGRTACALVSTVYTHGENGWPCYRIPGTLALPNDTLLSFAAARSYTGDHCYPLNASYPKRYSAHVVKRSTDGARQPHAPCTMAGARAGVATTVPLTGAVSCVVCHLAARRGDVGADGGASAHRDRQACSARPRRWSAPLARGLRCPLAGGVGGVFARARARPLHLPAGQHLEREHWAEALAGRDGQLWRLVDRSAPLRHPGSGAGQRHTRHAHGTRQRDRARTWGARGPVAGGA